MRQRLQAFSAIQIIVFAYLIAVLLCTVFLMLPISRKQGIELSLMDGLFVATSAISVTGLTTVNIVNTFSTFGQSILMLAFQFGGIGIMTLGSLLWLMLGQSITLSQRRLLMLDQNQTHLSGLVRLLLVIVRMVVYIELIGTILFGFYFKFAGYYTNWNDSFYYSLFHTLSSFTNAGFDLFETANAQFGDDYFAQAITMLLIVLGSIGFPVLVELREYVLRRSRGDMRFRFSLFTKITSITYISIMAVGAIGIWVMERTLLMADKSWHSQLFISLFNSVTLRSAGLSTIDFSEFGAGAHFFMSVLMFIGGSPSSTGGGIRTTTLAVLFLTLVSVARQRKEVTAFSRTIRHDEVLKSFFVFSLAVFLCITSIIAIESVGGKSFSLQAIIFEVTSAFGTCGASLGITSDLRGAAKWVIIILMFIGRIGLVLLLGLFHRDKKRTLKVRYPEEKIIIG